MDLGQNRWGEGERGAMRVEFFEQQKIDQARTDKEGRPIMKALERVRVTFAKSKDVRVNPASAICETDMVSGREYTWKERYPEEYARFAAQREEIGDGTPIELASFLTRTRKAELQAMNIRTIDVLASISPRDAKNLGDDGATIVKQAKAYLAKAASNVEADRLAAENETLATENASLEEQVAAMQAELEALRQEPAE